MSRVITLRLLLIVVISITMSLPVSSTSAREIPDPGQKGPYEVGFTSFTLIDPTRNTTNRFGGQPIPVDLWYPVDAEDVNTNTPEAIYPLDPLSDYNWPSILSSDWEIYGIDRAYQEATPSSDKPFPLVLLSAGWGFPNWMYIYFGVRLASHGFVVAMPYHYGEGWYWPSEPFEHIAVTSVYRPLDMSFMLTKILERNGINGDLLNNLVRPGQIAASGHSLGGYTAMVLAGGDDEVCDTFYGDPYFGDPPPSTCVPSYPDPRIKIVVMLDGSNQFLKYQELGRIIIPAIGIGEPWEYVESWQARQHAAITAHPNYRVDVNNAQHINFSSFCESFQMMGDQGLIPIEDAQWIVDAYCKAPGQIPSLEAQRLTTKYMVAFLKTHLVGESGYAKILTPGWAITSEEYIEFFVTEKRNPNATDEESPCCFMYFPHQPGSEQEQAEKDSLPRPPEDRIPSW